MLSTAQQPSTRPPARTAGITSSQAHLACALRRGLEHTQLLLRRQRRVNRQHQELGPIGIGRQLCRALPYQPLAGLYLVLQAHIGCVGCGVHANLCMAARSCSVGPQINAVPALK